MYTHICSHILVWSIYSNLFLGAGVVSLGGVFKLKDYIDEKIWFKVAQLIVRTGTIASG